MKFSQFRNEEGKLQDDYSSIIYNSDIIINGIPERAYEYTIDGVSAIEWIMNQYQVEIDKDTRIIDDPNEYSDDEKYIFNLLLRIINLSMKTIDLIESLPEFELDE
ncbi:type ISP restriction/modification enzyme [Facklamia languida]